MAKHQAFQRRKPQQARSQVTYDSILQAAIQILQRSGPDALNTNAIAERAGVSIGTLYQYFPDREAILLAAARRELADPQPGLAAALLDALAHVLESLLGSKSVRVRRQGTRAAMVQSTQDSVVKMVAVLGWLIPQPSLQPIALRTRR